jgi:hypothetical protein
MVEVAKSSETSVKFYRINGAAVQKTAIGFSKTLHRPDDGGSTDL